MSLSRDDSVWLTAFRPLRLPHRTEQLALLDWIAQAHATSKAVRAGLPASARAALVERLRPVIRRCAAGPPHLARRGHAIPDVNNTEWSENALYDLEREPAGPGIGARTRVYAAIVTEVFERAFSPDEPPPRDLVHVTCTGYVAPSPAQHLVEARGWGAHTRVTHAYHMGCYAAHPALRLAAGALRTPWPFASEGGARVDVVHTELASLHFDPGTTSMEQLVVQSLFADGLIRYQVVAAPDGPALRVRALSEAIVPGTADCMRWVVSDGGMQMTLARDVAARIGVVLRDRVDELYRRAGLPPAALWRSVAAIHPGGPRILDSVRELLELDEAQLAASRAVLRDHGNMSSATLPHVWARLVEDPAVPAGSLILSLAFGPGLTVCAGLLEKA